MSTRSKTKAALNAAPPPPPTPQPKPKSRSRNVSQSQAKPQADDADQKENAKAKNVKAKSKSRLAKAKKPTTTAKPVYCSCKKGDDGSPMVHCAQCKDWYHFDCVNLNEKDANDINVYICPSCTEKTGRRTAMEWEGPEAVEECADDHIEPTSAQDHVIAEEVEGVEAASEPAASESDEESSEDEYVVDKPKGKVAITGKRRTRRLSFSSESEAGSATGGETHSRDANTSASPAPASRGQLKRKAHTAAQPPPNKRKKSSSDTSASDDPVRKYCLGKLEEVFCQIFLKYPPSLGGGEEGDSASVDQTKVLTDEEKEKVESEAKLFATELEQCVYDIYSEPDKAGKLSAGGKYKERFRMLQFNLSKPDRVVLHKRIASSQIAAKELSLMSSTDLANEETKQHIKIAEKEALEHSILQKTKAPRAKITHKGLQDIEDVDGDVPMSRDRDRDREQQLEEEKRERERMARLRAAQAHPRSNSISVPPESPVAPQSASWGAPPPLPMHTLSGTENVLAGITTFASARPPTNPLFVHTPSDFTLPEPELNLADLINIDEDSSVQDATQPTPSVAAVQGTVTSGDAQPPPQTAPDTPIVPTGISPFVSQPPGAESRLRSASFDLNSLWTAPKAEPDLSSPLPVTDKEEESKDTVIEPVVAEEADDQDFDMFLDEKEHDTETPASPEAQQAAFDSQPQVWSGKINMPLDSTIPQDTPVVARQMGGRSLGYDSPLWRTLFPSDLLRIDGRVAVDTSSRYLIQMRMTSAKELIAVAFSPASAGADSSFRILMDFLIAKSRHGLVFPWGIRPKDHHPGKELYIIPLLSSDPLPDYVELLDELHLPKIRTVNYLLGIWVLNKGKLAPPPAPAPQPPVSHSFTPPIPQVAQQQPISIPSLASLPPPQPSSMPSRIETAALAAEVASLTPEQIQLMLRTLATVAPIAPPPAPAPIPLPNPQPWLNPAPPPATLGFGSPGYPNHRMAAPPPPPPQPLPPLYAEPYDQRRDQRPGAGFERDRGEWSEQDRDERRRGGRSRGGRGGRGRREEGGPPKPVDQGWPRRVRNDSGSNRSPPQQAQWNGGSWN